MQHSDKLFETIANYTYDWETWFSPDGRALWVNPAVERMTGYSVAECLSMEGYPLALVHPEDRNRIEAHLLSAAGGSSRNDVEFRILRKDREEVWAAVSWQTIVDDAGASIGFRTSVREINERKRVERELRRAYEEAERANRAKSRFLAAASHDLRQPLQAASLFVESLCQETTDPQLRHVVDSLRKCLSSTSDLLDALLDVSRLDAGVLEVQPQVFAIIDLFDRLQTDLSPAAASGGVDLRFAPSSAFVETDPILLGRVLQNLISNAVRYCRREHARVLVGARRSGAGIRLEVWDNGIGIEPDQLDTVFEEFYQVDNPQRDRTRGLGLGLAVVRRIVGLLDLGLDVRSWPGRGSVFSVQVPLADSAREATWTPESQVSERLDGFVVAAVDDEPMQLVAMSAFLSSQGGRVVTATGVDELVATLERRGLVPDALVVDYRLRDGERGGDAIGRIREALGMPVPAVLVTGDTEPARLLEANASGFELLHKPVSAGELVSTIARALRSSASSG